MFDPYRPWLGISEGQRPPTYYQLLGIAPTEADAEVIKEAALQRTSHVRVYQTGPYAEICTRLLNEIARARAILLDPLSRKEYDLGLQKPPTPASGRSIPAGAIPQAPSRGPLLEKLLAALAYGLLLLLGFLV